MDEVNNIIISVIVPLYNVELYLEKCLESIISQTYRNLEIILVDDGSTDCSGKICDTFAKQDERIIVIHKQNGGAISARKSGALVATGDYVIQVDGDDWIEKDRFENIVVNGLFDYPDMVSSAGIYLEYPDCSILKNIPDNVKGLHTTNEIWDNQNLYLMSKEVFIKKYMQLSLWSCCIKREIYTRNQLVLDDKVALGQDQIVSLACMMSCNSVRIIYNPTYHYRLQREGAISYRKTNYPVYSGKIYYESMKKYIEMHKIDNKNIISAISKFTFNTVMLTNYNVLYDYYADYLFPYCCVKNNSRIIVYGAGNLGVEIVNAINSDKRFELVGWVDKKKKQNLRSAYQIEKTDIIMEREFDYIVVAVMNAEVAMQIREELKKIIDENKVILMGYDDMSMDKLDDIFGSASSSIN